jgi:hypothetical protein
MEERPHMAPKVPQKAGCLMEATAVVTPLSRDLWPTCPNCGSLLDVWKTCPHVSAEVAASVSTSGRPVYCSGKEESDAANA